MNTTELLRIARVIPRCSNFQLEVLGHLLADELERRGTLDVPAAGTPEQRTASGEETS